ncbi:MAG: element excision factor XisH family protein [Caldilineaceae bacterium]
MPAKDFYHEIVCTALDKDGWTITHDPLEFRVGVIVRIDLGAEQLISADRGAEKIAVEVKSFLGASALSEFHGALGQYINYRRALRIEEPDRTLYLAVPIGVYNSFFSIDFIRDGLLEDGIKLVVYDPERKEIVQWRN